MGYYNSVAKGVIEIPEVEVPESEKARGNYSYGNAILIPVEIIAISNLFYQGNATKQVRSLAPMAPHSYEYELMGSLVVHSAATEGGGLRSNGRSVSPESYIKSWRKVLANPISLYWARQYLWTSLIMKFEMKHMVDQLMDEINEEHPNTISKDEDGKYIFSAHFGKDESLHLYRRYRSKLGKMVDCVESDDERGDYKEFLSNWQNKNHRYVA